MLRQECSPENTKHTTVCCVKPLGTPKANSTMTNAMSIKSNKEIMEINK